MLVGTCLVAPEGYGSLPTDMAHHYLANNAASSRVLLVRFTWGAKGAAQAQLIPLESNHDDGDGQHPPELISQMIDLVKQGYDIVQTQRLEDDRGMSFKKWSSRLFYRLINVVGGTRILEGAADFRALSRDALDGLRSMHEYHRFLRGMISWMGYASIILPFHEPARLAGKSKYSLGKMMRLASDAVFSFPWHRCTLG